jgi:hypothetical protein
MSTTSNDAEMVDLEGRPPLQCLGHDARALKSSPA